MRVQCCICSDLFVKNGTDIAATPCGHVFHEHCLARWLINASTCPACRKTVIQHAVIPKLFFDIAEEEPDGVNTDKLSNELQVRLLLVLGFKTVDPENNVSEKLSSELHPLLIDSIQGSQGHFKSLEIDFSIKLKGVLSPLIQPLSLSGGPPLLRVPLT